MSFAMFLAENTQNGPIVQRFQLERLLSSNGHEETDEKKLETKHLLDGVKAAMALCFFDRQKWFKIVICKF